MRDEHGVIEFVHFVCKYCKAPYENPMDFVKHKKEVHAVEIRPRLALLQEKTDENISGSDSSFYSESSQSQTSPQVPPKRLLHSSSSRIRTSLNLKRAGSVRTVQEKCGRFPFGCRLCVLRFNSYLEMAAHKRLKHPHLVPLMGNFDCPHCDSKHSCKKNFGAHVKKHRDAELSGVHISCRLCPKKFLAQSAYLNHQAAFHSRRASKHPAPKPMASNFVKPKVSPFRMKIPLQLRRSTSTSRPKVVLQLAPPPPQETPTKQNGHVDSEQSEDESPPLDHQFSEKRTSQQFRTLQRLPAPPAQMVFDCYFCDKHFKSREDRTEHETHVHKIQKKVHLAEVDESSSSSYYDTPAAVPSRTVDPLVYTCTFCDSSFTAMPSLLLHVQSAHGTPPKTKNQSLWASMRNSPKKIANLDKGSSKPTSGLGNRSRPKSQKTISVAEVAQKVRSNAPQGSAVAAKSALNNQRSPSAGGARFQVKKKFPSAARIKSCKDCDYQCVSDSGMYYHRLSVHPDTRQYKCDQCRFSFVRKGQLQLHYRMHTGETPHTCQFCDSAFTAHGILVRHMKKDHLKEKLYSCQLCSIIYYTFDDWYRHMHGSHTVEEIEGMSMDHQ